MKWSISPIQLAMPVLLAVVITNIVRQPARSTRAERKGYPLPPGPTPFPLLGSTLSINAKEPWLTYTKWRAKYGDIMYLRLFDTSLVVLNTPSVAVEFLGNRSQICSDRPFIATLEPYGHDCNFALSRYGEHWRLCRRIFHQTFRAEASLTFRPMQLHRARQMIANVIDDPLGFPSHYSTFAAAVAMSSVYDYEPKPRDDPIVSIMERFVRISFPALTPEKAVLLRMFPFLLYIPDWLPGSWVKREAREASTCRKKMVEIPYQYVQRRLESKEHINDAMVFDHITRMENFEPSYRAEYEKALKHASITAFIASVESTSSILLNFTLAMVQNPQVWKCAQAEIDSILGIHKLPEFEDRRLLPYIEAIVRETHRWKSIVPLGVPHATTSSDIYKGFYIPKGTTVIPNIWAMLHDETRYPNPEVFIPERFLDAEGLLIKDDPAELIFGFGRRTCPGRHAADASVWSAIATMLATLEFNVAKDENGKDVVFEPIFKGGLTLRPNEFPCDLTPRAHLDKEVFERILA